MQIISDVFWRRRPSLRIPLGIRSANVEPQSSARLVAPALRATAFFANNKMIIVGKNWKSVKRNKIELKLPNKLAG